MSGLVKEILHRRSYRKYKKTMVSETDLHEIVEAGMYAPSARGMQSTVFVVVTDKKTRDYLSDLNARVMHSKSDPFYGAPAVIVVLGNTESPNYIYDGSTAMENLMLAADSKGLGSCWIHRAKEVFSSQEGKELLQKWGLKGNYDGIGHCIIGYPDEEVPVPAERKENRIFWVK